ncbi:LamG-like jellyroll fold domain-containing protein [Streptomyces sp. NPDC048623]|uniref:LamG-like jellyroll fold domain-containing protein n=1 Tax=Streptomyces sp. NPDC048623 TaxID=3155761 RepID=UPI00342B8500
MDTTLKPLSRSGRLGQAVSTSADGWRIAAGETETTFAGFADGAPLVSLKTGSETSVGFAIQGAANAPGEAGESTITYRRVLPASDVRFIATGASVKEVLYLNSGDAPAEWTFPLYMQGLTGSLDPTGAVLFKDVSGSVRARIPTGWMEDSNLASNSNQGEISSGVRYELLNVEGGQALKVSLDYEWLHDPRRVFPVKVDPTVTSVTPVAASSGTFVEYPYNTNFASDTNIKVGTYDAGGHKAAGFLHFAGVESSLKNAWVLGASLAFYNTWSYSCTARPVTIHPVISAWSETTTSTYPGPTTGAALASKSFAHGWRPEGQTTYPCGGAAWEGINLGSAGRQLVDDWTHGRKKNYGLAIKASTTDSFAWKNFGSDDYPNAKPSLDVTWTKYGATYKLGTLVTPMTATSEGAFSVTVTNQGQETWPANGNYKLRYRLYGAAGQEITDTSKLRWTNMPTNVAPGGSVTVNAKIAPLTPGTYTIAWTMDDYGVTTFSGAGIPTANLKVTTANLPPNLTSLAPPSGTVVDSLTPALWAIGTDFDRYPKALEYQFEVCEVEGSNTRENCRMGTRGTSTQWSVPAGWLAWSKTYAWYGYAYDGSATSVRPAASFLTTQVPQPPITSHLGASDAGQDFGERNGNYATAATDAAIPTIGPELSVTRTYNSQDTRQNNVFGAGWATRWDMRAVIESSGSVLITLSTGAQVRFGRNADGTYAAPSGSVGVLMAETGGGWTLRDGSATLHTFDAGGRLTKITDGQGRAQLLTYTDGKLTRATDALSGRYLAFTWAGSHAAATETSEVNGVGSQLKWTYTYDGDRLVKVCPPESTAACTQYTYENGSQYRSMVLDANPTAYWRLNETEGEAAASETASTTGLSSGRYRDAVLGSEGALTGTSNKAVGFGGYNVGSHIELPDAALSSSTVVSVELWFKSSTPSGVILGFQDTPLSDINYRYNNPVFEIDPHGKLRGSFDTVSTPIAPMSSGVAVTDGAWHHAVLSSSGTSQTLYVDGVAVGSISGPVNHGDKTFTYLGAGYSSWGYDGELEGVRHFQGSLDEVAVYHHALDAATVREHFEARAGSSRLTKVTLPSGRTSAQVTYDGDTERVTEVMDGAGTWKVSAPVYESGSRSYTTAVRSAAPTNYWRLGDNSGAAARDEIPLGADGSYRDGVTLGQVGAFSAGDDGAAAFDGTEGAVEVPADALEAATALSVELWFRTDHPGGVLFGLQNTEIGTTPLMYNPSLLVDVNGRLRGYLWRGGSVTPITSSTAVTDNEWHHAVITGGTTGQTLYLDGVKIGSLTGAVKPETLAYAYLGAGHSNLAWDGGTSNHINRYFQGSLDEAALYTKELSAQTVLEHYHARNKLVSGNSDQYRAAVSANAPAAYWRLDEATGTQVNSKVAAVNGTGTYTKTTLGATGAFGTGDNTAVTFNGDGYAEVPPVGIGTADVSATLWFRTNKPGVMLANQALPMAGATDAGVSWAPILYVGTDGKLRGEYFSPGVQQSNASPGTVTDNQWHHAAVTAEGGVQSLYLDGTMVATKSGAPVDHESNNHTYIGAGFAKTWPASPGSVSFFTGQLDEVAVYRHALTADQVADEYDAATRASASSLTSTVTVTDPMGAKTSSTFDAVRGQRRIASTDADGGVTTYAYDTGGFLHTVTDPNGHATITGHDAQGNTVSRTTCRDANSCWTSYSEYYNNTADPLDPRNGKQTVARDARSTGPSDSRYATTTAYTALGLPEKLTLADGRTSSTTYTVGTEPAVGGGVTPAGLVASTVTPEGAVTAYAYFANGDLAKITDPNGLVTSFTYDGIGRKTGETQISDTYPDGVTTAYGYDSLSNVTTETGASTKNEITGVTHTAKTTRAFDADGNLLSETVEDLTGGDIAHTTTRHYDERGFSDSVTDAEGNTTTYGFDALGQVISEKDALGTETTYKYTSRGAIAETVLKNWTGQQSGEPRDLVLESNAYDPAGRLASTTDALGATTSFSYFDDDLLATTTALQVEQADGTHRDIPQEINTYDGANYLIKQVTNGGTLTETFTVDATGRITRSVLDPSGLNRSMDYVYDKDDRLTDTTRHVSVTESQTEHVTYDQAGNTTTAALTSGSITITTRNTYDRRGLLLTSTSPRGTKPGADPAAYTTTYRYDALGRLVEQAAPAVTIESYGNAAQQQKPTTTHGYNTFGDLSHSRDENGAVTSSDFDRLGRTTALNLPTYTPPGGTTITPVHRTAYDAIGRVTSTTDPLERTTRYAYDQLDHLTQRIDPLVGGATPLNQTEPNPLTGASTSLSGEGVTHYTWTPTDLPLSVTTPTGSRTEATYDRLGRQLTATAVERYPSLRNLTTRYTWDDADNQIVVTSPAGRVSTSTYNPAGEPLTVTPSGEGTTRYTYDGLGRQTSVTDGTNRKSTFTYDLLDNITAAADYGTGSTALRTYLSGFDEEGNQTSATTPAGGSTVSVYDALGRLTRQEEKVSGTKTITSTFGYDARGDRTRFTDGRGNTTHYTFNAWGLAESTIEPATSKHPEAADRTWTTVYNAMGEPVIELLPGNVKRQRSYDVLGRLIREEGSGTIAPTTPHTFSYDLDGRLTGVGTSAIGPANTYTHNDRGMLLQAQGPSGNSQYSYDDEGNMTSRKDAAGTTAYTYDAASRLDTAADPLTGTLVQYEYDGEGRPVSEQYARTAAGGQPTVASQRTYGYDSLGRQTTDTVTRTATGVPVTSSTYGYDLDDHLVRKTTTGTAGAADNTYTYDLSSRMTSWTSGTSTIAYGWDDAGNLVKQGDTDGVYDARNRLETWGTQTYTYSPRGTTDGITQGGGTTRSLTFDAFERAVSNGSSTFTYDSLDRVLTDDGTQFTYDGVTNNLATDATTAYTRTPDGTLLASAGLSTAGFERLAITDQHSDLVAGLSVDGTSVTGSRAYDPFGKVTASDGTNPALGYQSGWTDPATGEVNMAARWFQPGTGAFTSRDTWQLDPTPSGQANRFAYAEGDPLGGTDPTGHAFDPRNGGGGPGAGGRGGAGGSGGGGGSVGRSRPSTRSAGTRSANRARNQECSRYSSRCSTKTTKNRGRRPSTTRQSARSQECSKYSSMCKGTTRPSTRSSTRPDPKGKGCTTGTCRGTNSPKTNRGNTGNKGKSPGNGTSKPPQPSEKTPIKQNPNGGKSPKPAPVRTKPKPQINQEQIQQQSRENTRHVVAAIDQAVIDAIQPLNPTDAQAIEALEQMFPEGSIENDHGLGGSGYEGMRKRRNQPCSLDFPSADPDFQYAPMTRFGSAPEDCRATGAVATIDEFDLRPWRLDPKWNPAGWESLPARDRARLHLIGNQMGGADYTMRNFVTGYQDPANTPHMRGLENDIVKAVRGGETVRVGVLARYGGSNPAIPDRIEMFAVGNKGYLLDCTVYNRPTGGVQCNSRSSGGPLSVP